jgi:ubiquinone biosynthesis protein COQ4
MLRHRQTHDFSHVLTGLTRVSVENEILLKWFEFSQTGLPVSLLSGLSGPLKFRRSLHGESAKGEELSKIALAIQSGARCDFLLNVMYEDEFATDLDTLRAKLGIQLII